MNVGIVGTGPAAAAIRTALEATDENVEAIDEVTNADFEAFDLVAVGGESGADRFERANERALATETPWIAVELGGLGGVSDDPDAAVSGFSPETGCYSCLRSRLVAAKEGDDAGEGTVDSAALAPSTVQLAGAIAGRETMKLLSGTDPVLPGRVIELPHAERRFLPVPGCECGEEAGRTRPWADSIPREHTERSLDETVARAEMAFDERVGVITEIGEAESVPLPYYFARAASTAGFSDASAPREAAGVAGDWDAAFMKALGESLERYSAGIYRTAEFTTGSPAALDDAISPAEFVGSESPDPEESLSWIEGETLDSGASVLLPAEFVVFPPPEGRFGPSITTGLGLGSSGPEALLSGLYETIERDATMLSWYSTFEALGLSEPSERFEALSRRAESEGLEATALLVTQDIDVPVVSVSLRREDWPRFAVGSAANLDVGTAAESALCEALQNWMELRRLGRENASDAEGEIGYYSELPEEIAGFSTPETTIPAATVGSGASFESPDEELKAVLGRLDDASLSAYGARLTTRDLALLGFESVRVLVPGAQPLFTESMAFDERAREVPRDLGFEPRLDRAFHPYP